MINKAVNDLRERIEKLEATQKTGRGRVNMTKAANYLGRSREWLRQQQEAGRGPPRATDGSYSLDDLDAWVETVPHRSEADMESARKASFKLKEAK